jgi:hypothetical protein
LVLDRAEFVAVEPGRSRNRDHLATGVIIWPPA